MSIRISSNASNSGTSVTIAIDGGETSDIVVTLCTVSGNPETGMVKLSYNESGGNFEYPYAQWVVTGITYGSALATEEAIAALLVLPTSGGGGGGVTGLNYIPTAGTAFSPTAAQFNGKNIFLMTDNSGSNVVITLPDATLVTPGSVAWFNMIGGDTVSFKNSVSGQTLDGLNINSAVQIDQPSYPNYDTGDEAPKQQIGCASDGEAWHIFCNY